MNKEKTKSYSNGTFFVQRADRWEIQCVIENIIALEKKIIMSINKQLKQG